MGVLDLNNNTVTPAPFKTQRTLKTSTLFESELRTSAIRYQVDGMKWSIDYFNQILNTNTQPMAPDPNVPETTLSYNRIDKLDIYVSSGLPSGQAVDITGTGTINAGFVPYVGDAFLATVAGGRIAIFVLTTVTKEYYNTHDIYVVDYKLTYFADTSATIYNDLVYKTVRTYTYDREIAVSGGKPVLLNTDYKRRIDLAKQPVILARHYIKTFLDNNNMLLVLPTNTSVYTDQLVTDMFLKMVSVNDVPEVNTIVRTIPELQSITIWDAIINRDIDMLAAANRDIVYSHNVVGTGVSSRVNSYLGVTYALTERAVGISTVPNVVVNPILRTNVPPLRTRPTDKYIFSDSFYNNDPNVIYTDFETVLLEYIRGQLPNRAIVESLVASYKYWAYEDQYLLLPMLMVLVKYLVNTTYSAI